MSNAHPSLSDRRSHADFLPACLLAHARTFDTIGPLITAAPWPPAPGTPALALTHPKLMHATPRWTTGESSFKSGKAGLTRRATSSGCFILFYFIVFSVGCEKAGKKVYVRGARVRAGGGGVEAIQATTFRELTDPPPNSGCICREKEQQVHTIHPERVHLTRSVGCTKRDEYHTWSSHYQKSKVMKA